VAHIKIKSIKPVFSIVCPPLSLTTISPDGMKQQRNPGQEQQLVLVLIS